MAEMKFITVNAPVGGLRLDVPSTLLPDTNSPALTDIRFIDNYIEKAKGAAAFAGTGGTALNGDVMKLAEFGNDAGSRYLLAMTTTKVYELTAGTFADRSSAAFTGDQDDRFYAVAYNNMFIFGNGKDTLRKWTTTTADDANLTNATDYRPNWIQIMGERLCLYGVYNTATNYPRRIRWSVAGDPEDWAGSGSGAKDLKTELRDGDEIQRAEPLGNSMVIYGRTSTAMQDYRESVDSPFPTSAVSDEFGLAAPDALVNIAGGEHISMTLENIVSYKGGRAATPIDAAIHNDLFDNINRQYMNRSFMTFAPEHDKARLFYPRGAATEPSHYYELNLKGMTWTRGVRAFTGAGRYRDATNDIYTMYGDTSGVVYEDDETDLNVGSTAITGQFESPDFLGDEKDQTSINNWMTLYVEAKGGASDKLTVEFSTNSGASWVAAPPRLITLTTAWKTYRLDFEIDSEKVRFRFSNAIASESFAIRMYKVGYMAGSEMGAA